MFGAFLLAVYNGDAEEFQTISKIGTGFSEEQLKVFSEQLRDLTIPQPRPYYRSAFPNPQSLLPAPQSMPELFSGVRLLMPDGHLCWCPALVLLNPGPWPLLQARGPTTPFRLPLQLRWPLGCWAARLL